LVVPVANSISVVGGESDATDVSRLILDAVVSDKIGAVVVEFAAVLDKNEKPEVVSVVTGASVVPSLGDGIREDDGVCKKLNDDVPAVVVEEEAAAAASAGTPSADSSADCFNVVPVSVAPAVVVELADVVRKLKARVVPVVSKGAGAGAGAVAATLLSGAAADGWRNENPDDDEATADTFAVEVVGPSTTAGCGANVAEFKNEKALVGTAVVEDDESAKVVVVDVLSCRDRSGVPLISKPPNMIDDYHAYVLLKSS